MSLTRPIVIAHRGASGYRPEHTLAAYALAIAQGADFIEPDLVATRDGFLIARHENELSGSTDVAARPEFAARRCHKRVDGRDRSGWFSEDFTLAEIRTLRARERLPELRPASAAFDGRFGIPTLAEILQLVCAAEADGRRVGLYPETKSPTWFAHEGRHLDGEPIGVSLGARLLEELQAAGFTDPARVFIQSFELANLLELKRRLMPAAGVALPLVLLLGPFAKAAPYDLAWHAARGDDLASVYGDGAPLHADLQSRELAEPARLAWLKQAFATGLGPCKDDLLPASVDGAPGPCLRPMLEAGLLVHPYTLRAEFDGAREARRLIALGVQGFFTDQPDLGVAAVRESAGS